MPTDPLQVLSLDEAKHQLAIELTRTDLDVRITHALKSAVYHVQEYCGVPLIDYSKTYQRHPVWSAPGTPIRLPVLNVKAVTEVKYLQKSQALREEPTGRIDVSTLGRVVEDGNHTAMYPPDGGWPSHNIGSDFEITVTIGVANVDDRWKTEVALWLRQIFESPDSIHNFRGLHGLGDGPVRQVI